MNLGSHLKIKDSGWIPDHDLVVSGMTEIMAVIFPRIQVFSFSSVSPW